MLYDMNTARTAHTDPEVSRLDGLASAVAGRLSWHLTDG